MTRLLILWPNSFITLHIDLTRAVLEFLLRCFYVYRHYTASLSIRRMLSSLLCKPFRRSRRLVAKD